MPQQVLWRHVLSVAGRYQLTASFSALPALKPGILAALISIGSPVCGLRPVRAARSLTAKVPKPTRTTESPAFRAPVMDSMTASRARPAAALGRSADEALASISSDLFTLSPLISLNELVSRYVSLWF